MSEKSPISIDEIVNCKSTLKSIRGDNKHKLIVAHLNINSIRNKLDLLVEQFAGNIDVLMVSETKIDESFPVRNFLLPGFSVPYRSDRDSKGGGILLYIGEYSIKPFNYKKDPIEGFYVKLNLQKNKWFVNSSYNPHKIPIENHLLVLSDSLDVYSSTFDK